MRMGFLNCRGCGAETNCADSVSGFCPVCAEMHVRWLATLQRDYDAAVRANDHTVTTLITAYERSEGLRLKEARRIQIRTERV